MSRAEKVGTVALVVALTVAGFVVGKNQTTTVKVSTPRALSVTQQVVPLYTWIDKAGAVHGLASTPPTTPLAQKVVEIDSTVYTPPAPPTSTTVPTTTVAPSPSTTPTTQPGPVTTTTTATPAGLIFSDEFNGTSLDLSKWQPNWLGSSNSAITKPINGSEQSCYDPAQVSVSGGNLVLTATQRTCQSWSWASGIVTTHGKFNFTNGTIEARIWTPGSSSMADWPAFWTDGNGTWPQTGENDILEGLSGKACWHYHSPSGGPGGCVGPLVGWHVYKAVVANGTSTYYYDGTKVGSESTVNAPHYVILNLGVGGAGGSSAAGSMLVDYIRVSS